MAWWAAAVPLITLYKDNHLTVTGMVPNAMSKHGIALHLLHVE